MLISTQIHLGFRTQMFGTNDFSDIRIQVSGTSDFRINQGSGTSDIRMRVSSASYFRIKVSSTSGPIKWCVDKMMKITYP